MLRDQGTAHAIPRRAKLCGADDAVCFFFVFLQGMLESVDKDVIRKGAKGKVRQGKACAIAMYTHGAQVLLCCVMSGLVLRSRLFAQCQAFPTGPV